MSIELINKTTALISKNDDFVGSGVLIPWKEELLCLTAGHNLYGKAFDQMPVLSEWIVSDHLGIAYSIGQIYGDNIFASNHDIILLKLNNTSSLEGFCCLKFCTIPQNPKHSLMFRGKYESSTEAVTQRSIIFNSISTDSYNKFRCAINPGLLTNDTYKSGSDWLGGWSGSGLFIDNHAELICAGVMIEIPNKGNDGHLLFSSISALKELGFNFELIEAGELDFDHNLSQASLNAIFQETTDQAIEAWENDGTHKPQLDFINDKLSKVYPDNVLKENKRKVIKRLIVGKTYLNTELKKREQLYRLYNSAYNVYSLEDKNYYVNSKIEAKKVLTKIKEDYEKYLNDCIGNIFSVSDIKLLAFFGVSEWIADCSLSFLSDE